MRLGVVRGAVASGAAYWLNAGDPVASGAAYWLNAGDPTRYNLAEERR